MIVLKSSATIERQRRDGSRDECRAEEETEAKAEARRETETKSRDERQRREAEKSREKKRKVGRVPRNNVKCTSWNTRRTRSEYGALTMCRVIKGAYNCNVN